MIAIREQRKEMRSEGIVMIMERKMKLNNRKKELWMVTPWTQ